MRRAEIIFCKSKNHAFSSEQSAALSLCPKGQSSHARSAPPLPKNLTSLRFSGALLPKPFGFFGRGECGALIMESIWRAPQRGKPLSRKGGGCPLRSKKKICLFQIFFFEERYTISTATSAGETPEMRPACPRFSGRILFSFCRASSRSPSMLS